MAKRRRSTRAIGAAVVRRTTPQPAREPWRLPSLRFLVGAAAIVAVVAFVGLAFLSSSTAAAYNCEELLGAPAGASEGEAFSTESLGSQHVTVGTRIRYGFCPPTSGSHYSAAGAGPLRPGFYGPGDAAGPGGWVHNLEHGYVVALYRCADGNCPPEPELEALRTFAANGPPTQAAAACGYRSKVLVARFDDLSTPFALVAWDRALLLDAFDPSIARDFAGRSLEATAPEPNAC
ncbi:MAG: DUF3105 domain-containing protein [Chloroflexota bacterium]